MAELKYNPQPGVYGKLGWIGGPRTYPPPKNFDLIIRRLMEIRQGEQGGNRPGVAGGFVTGARPDGRIPMVNGVIGKLAGLWNLSGEPGQAWGRRWIDKRMAAMWPYARPAEDRWYGIGELMKMFGYGE